MIYKCNGDSCTTVGMSNPSIFQYAMSDVMNSYREIIVMCAASMIISFIIILLLGWIAQIMIWGIAIASAVACVAGPAYFWLVSPLVSEFGSSLNGSLYGLWLLAELRILTSHTLLYYYLISIR